MLIRLDIQYSMVSSHWTWWVLTLYYTLWFSGPCAKTFIFAYLVFWHISYMLHINTFIRQPLSLYITHFSFLFIDHNYHKRYFVDFKLCVFTFQLLFLIMDDFVLNKLTQWDLSELIQIFKGKVLLCFLLGKNINIQNIIQILCIEWYYIPLSVLCRIDWSSKSFSLLFFLLIIVLNILRFCTF